MLWTVSAHAAPWASSDSTVPESSADLLGECDEDALRIREVVWKARTETGVTEIVSTDKDARTFVPRAKRLVMMHVRVLKHPDDHSHNHDQQHDPEQQYPRRCVLA